MERIEPRVFRISKEELGCSQPYLDKTKLKYFSNCEIKEILLPVIKLENKYYLTDGHSRAFLSKSDSINVYLDKEIISSESLYEAYKVFINWTKDLGVNNIYDLSERIINEISFKEKWIDRCENYFQEISK